jgi:hypothetical protein
MYAESKETGGRPGGRILGCMGGTGGMGGAGCTGGVKGGRCVGGVPGVGTTPVSRRMYVVS